MYLLKRCEQIWFRVFDYGDCYMAMASKKNCAVMNCFGTTPERAKEIAAFKLRTALNKNESSAN